MTTKNEREIKTMIISCGLQLLNLTVTGGNHFKARIQAPDGRTDTHVFGKTCSDHRAAKNARAMLRRFAEGRTV